MQLAKKKTLAAKVLKVGKNRIVFSEENLADVKEAITRQDILDLKDAGIIKVKDVKGRLKVEKRKRGRGIGKVKKKVNKRKKEYVTITRKLRKVAKGLLRFGKVDNEKYREIRREIRARNFKSKRHLNEQLEEV